MAVITLAIMAAYGVIASLILPLFGKSGLINWTVSRGYYYLGGFLTGISATIEGRENLKLANGPAVLVCNHQTSLDVMLMASVFPKNTSVVAKKAIKYYPFLGWYMTLSNAIFLDRKNRDSAIKEARKAADDIHKKKTSVWLFPEGTRGHSSEITLLPFKKGAFHMAVQAHVPIIPVVIANYHNLYNSKAKRFDAGNVNIRVLPPVSTDGVGDDSASIEKLSVEIREKMLQALKEISVDASKKSQ
ncbi:1-acylglycerol-3-phosphate O-acyltransferase [Apophysomyces ossiformis]|uniref:1-acyl-sn-glycerol-3-phosphate acyltransferase n=1 Tax=Apophysomyces ossiformis TaxID=679940 RepID=A0A8H7BSN8_9FUNG|nr:1-acylglycerol-3-phosphate O-acyltransferase [Apophysomyces ossiformis]